MQPTSLRCEDLIEPLGIGAARPRFAWDVSAAGQIQQAWRIQVWDERGTVPRWDSGRTESAEQFGIAYAGPPLAKHSVYRWRVKLWGPDGNGSTWSGFARFETACFALSDWDSPWLAYEWAHLAPERQSVNHVRREFAVASGRPVRRARIYVAARISFQVLIEHEDGAVVLIGADRSCRWNLAGPFLQLWRHDV